MNVAEVDGNRTRRTGVARPARFEDGGAHQVLRHLHAERYGLKTGKAILEERPWHGRSILIRMKKFAMLAALAALISIAVKKVRSI